MDGNYYLRPARGSEALVIASHRGAMFRDMGAVNDAEAAKITEASLPQLSKMMEHGQYLGWMVLHNGWYAASGGMILRKTFPRPNILEGGTEALIVNVYTEPEHRRRGLARQLMQTMLDWCKQNHIANVVLHASDEGRPLYHSLGFVPTNEMRWQASKLES